MSLFKDMSITCPKCGAVNRIAAVESVNADRRPDLREAILAGTFQVIACESCAEPIKLEPQFNYLGVAAGLWIAAYPGRIMPDFLTVEDNVTEIFRRSYGAGAMASAQGVGETLQTRLTFGWPALREKLFLRGEGIDDVEVEMLKLDLMRRLPEAPLAPGVELRMVARDEAGLVMTWVEAVSEQVLQEFIVAPALLEEIRGNPDGWAPIRAALEDGPFVDMQKLYMGEGRAVAE